MNPVRRFALRTTISITVASVACSGMVSAASDTTAPDETAAASGYPVTIAHKYGETVVEEYPERIVVVGLLEQDALLALGVVPVATTEWFGEHPGAVWPWATDELRRPAPSPRRCSDRRRRSTSRASPPRIPT